MSQRDPRHDVLFEPVRIGPKTLRNRFYQVPHCSGLGVLKPLSNAYFRGMKAEGGWAAVCTEYAPISPESDGHPSAAANLWDDGDGARLALLCDEAHRHGALAGIELVHTGVHARQSESRLPRLAPSQLASDYHPMNVPKAMDQDDIARAQRQWADAARRAVDVGFDIVYVFADYLVMQFLAPFYNHRTDRYGGSFENRARFGRETLELVRETVGDRCALAARFSVESLGPAGVGIDEGLEFIRFVDALVDLWDVKVGTIADMAVDNPTSRISPAGNHLPWTRRVREATDKPIVSVGGRLTDPDQMVELVRSGALDLIGAARPSIADPFLPRKIEEGRYDEIRECIGANLCIARHGRGHIACTQNATAGEEYRRGWHPERFERATNADNDVLVIGAGPAGMECAIVLGKRGFRRVHLVDAATEIGGCLRWVTRLPGLGEWSRLVNWRRIQLDRLANVEVITGRRLDAGQVLEYGAELVVIATGARWSGDGLNPITHTRLAGADHSSPFVLTPEQIMLEGKRPPGKRVVVFDCEGSFTGSTLAELLAREEHTVDLITPLREIASASDELFEGEIVRQRLHDLGVRMHRATSVERVTPDHVELVGEFGETRELATDAIVLVTQRVSDDALYAELDADRGALTNADIAGLYRVGDCVAPGDLGDTIFSGHRLAREIDSRNPAVALPHLRELMVPSAAQEANAVPRRVLPAHSD
jgi:dimethylamine/trimethylamine dehydrogenase